MPTHHHITPRLSPVPPHSHNTLAPPSLDPSPHTSLRHTDHLTVPHVLLRLVMILGLLGRTSTTSGRPYPSASSRLTYTLPSSTMKKHAFGRLISTPYGSYVTRPVRMLPLRPLSHICLGDSMQLKQVGTRHTNSTQMSPTAQTAYTHNSLLANSSVLPSEASTRTSKTISTHYTRNRTIWNCSCKPRTRK